MSSVVINLSSFNYKAKIPRISNLKRTDALATKDRYHFATRTLSAEESPKVHIRWGYALPTSRSCAKDGLHGKYVLYSPPYLVCFQLIKNSKEKNER